MTAQKIPIDDLNAPVRGHPLYHSDDVHFNDQGIQIIDGLTVTDKLLGA